MENNWERLIFLDIDGTITGKYGEINPECIKKLNRLKEFGTKVVVSSSWGYDDGRTEQSLKAKGLELPIIGYTDHFYEDWLCRGNEIEKWLLKNYGGMGTKFCNDYDNVPYYRKSLPSKKQDYEFVIFDDSADMLLGQKNNFIQTNEIIGITDDDIEKAIKILNRKNI